MAAEDARPGEADVTVVIPCYNHAHYLEECLESVVGQTYERWHAVVVDDASSDHELIEPVIRKFDDPRIRLVRHEVNKGLGASRNTGIRASTTPLVYPVDADDKLDPKCLEHLVPRILADDSLDCIFADVLLFGRRNGVVGFPGPPKGQKLTRVENTIPGAGTMMRKTFWEKVGGYDEIELLRHGREDFEFWMRAFRKGCNFLRVEEPLYLYRQSHTSMNFECRLHEVEIREYLVQKHREAFDSEADVTRFMTEAYDMAAKAAHLKGKRAQAFKNAWRAWRLTPTRGNLKNVGRSLLTPDLARSLNRGDLRRLVPFLGYPLHGDWKHRPFFVIGVGRSGNTLFRRILTSHSGLHVPPETFVLTDCIDKFRRYGRSLSWPDLVKLVLAQFEFHPEYHTIDVWLGPLAQRLSALPPHRRNLASLIDGFFRYHAEQSDKPEARWGDKTPLNSLDPRTIETLAEIFPDAQFLHIYRDGCDVVYSHLSGGFYRSIAEASDRWSSVIRSCRSFVERHRDRCHELSYEDLVTSPEKTVRDVCAFLGVGFEPTMIASEKSSSKLGDVQEWFWHKKVHEPITPSSVGKGRDCFSTKEREELQAHIGPELALLGYPPATAARPRTNTG